MNISLEIAFSIGMVVFNAGIIVGGFYALRKDILRLERKQEESNRIKERLIITEENMKAAWIRIDELRGKL